MSAFLACLVTLVYRKFIDETKDEVRREYYNFTTVFKNDEYYEIPGEFVVARREKYYQPTFFPETTHCSGCLIYCCKYKPK